MSEPVTLGLDGMGKRTDDFFIAKRKMGKHGHQNGDPGYPERIGDCHTQRGGDTTESGQVSRINFKYFIFWNLAQTLTIEGAAGTISGLPCQLAVGCWASPDLVLSEDSFPQCHFSWVAVFCICIRVRASSSIWHRLLCVFSGDEARSLS